MCEKNRIAFMETWKQSLGGGGGGGVGFFAN
jgi:hypothetical protein